MNVKISTKGLTVDEILASPLLTLHEAEKVIEKRSVLSALERKQVLIAASIYSAKYEAMRCCKVCKNKLQKGEHIYCRVCQDAMSITE